MSNRWLSFLVTAFWLAMMSWLTVTKIVPPLLKGDPPSYQSILDGPQAFDPVGWRLYWNDQPIGFAVSKVERRADGMTETQSFVRMTNLPLSDVVPMWMASWFRQNGEEAKLPELTAESVFSIDPLGRLASFHSTLGLGEGVTASMQGVVMGEEVELKVRSGELVQSSRMFLARDALVGDVLSPYERLPDLQVGQTWTVPIYSPFSPPTSPLEVLSASVERDDWLVYEGETVETRLVVYRSDGGAADRPIRGRVWVRRDGTVLKQELRVLNGRLVFQRHAGPVPRDWLRRLRPSAAIQPGAANPVGAPPLGEGAP